MELVKLNDQVSISGQIAVNDIDALARDGVEVVLCNRPDREAEGQTDFASIAAAAEAAGMQALHVPFKSGAIEETHVAEMNRLLDSGKRIHAYCRTGNRSVCLYAVARAEQGVPKASLIREAAKAGMKVEEVLKPYYEESGEAMNTEENAVESKPMATAAYDIVVVGAGSGGIAVTASLQKRHRGLRIALIDPADVHYYQPGWTMVGGGVFDVKSTKRMMQDLIPKEATWIKQSVTAFHPAENEVELGDGSRINYQQLIVSPGLKLDWDAIDGLKESLGSNGVTSNYAYELAPYTWELVSKLKEGKAVFTQPPMPIKCAGAPQKAMYLSCDQWRRDRVLNSIDVDFCNAGGVLFGVNDYVPALQSYIDRYGVNVNYFHQLEAVDGKAKLAHFKVISGENEGEQVTKQFDMIHVCPPQTAPDFVANSELAGEGGWLEVDQFSLQHKRFANVWGLGDVMNTPNAKTMAAVRKQVPVVAQNITDVLHDKPISSGYDGYGSCPLTVERGKIVLAEFGYGGKILPTFPTWMLEGKKATRAAWILKKDILPAVYWKAMLKGHEWMAGPEPLEKVRV